MFNIAELIFLILVLFGLQRYLSSRDNKWLGLIVLIIFNFYLIYNFKYVHQDIEYLWYKAVIGNIILLLDYYLGLQKRKERYKNEIQRMKSKDI
ncbi:hypothetical protein WER97_03485 [Staphylococcus felis]|uniref:Uncharacterized protein n=1 Tax=Staphylococcus felis TaxID=46127 RepID=A0ABS0QQA3_9STAP|nr:hypothetical protein [Staphylococcus felis]MBH9581425.1 hypothetical protein [Staphylococcus felis]REI04578.1 hypothetical protein DOS69_11405 [Staphylococcus felis]REI10524.1 hypothetical protein DOS71_05360 [Staphylococcus felis]